MDLIKVLGPSWAPVIGEEFKKDYMKRLSSIVRADRKIHNVYPEPSKVLRAFHETPYEDVKVVILGQDPYPTPGNANGLAFSFDNGSVPDNYHDNPASLQNIFKEIEDDLGEFSILHDSDLTRWARQGVLLLNTCLTVIERQPGSHANIGWETFVQRVITKLNAKPNRVVYLLWGRSAQSYKPFIRGHHEYLETSHPSPLSAYRGFFGCKHFSLCNQILEDSNQQPIKWITRE